MSAPRKQSGMTVLELLIVMGIFSMAVLGVVGFIIQSYKANLFADQQSEAISQARRGLDTMIKEIREASPSENGSYPIDSAQTQNLIFYSDIDSDEEIERIRYTLTETDLIKGVTEPSGFPPEYINPEQTKILSRYVQNGSEPIFYYYNGDYPNDTENNPLSYPVQIQHVRLIRTYLKINVDPRRAPEDFLLISNSQIRNLKDNL